MNRILFKEFQVKDLNFETIEDISDRPWDDEFAKAVEASKLSVSGVLNNQIVGCGGVHPIDEFHGELWLRLSRWCLEHKIETVRWLQEGLKIIEATYPFKQLNASVKQGFCDSERLLRFLGFEDVELNDGFTIFAKRVKE